MSQNRAMVLDSPGTKLTLLNRPRPDPGPGEVLVRVGACGVCRTDLHVVDGDLSEPSLPIVPGHKIVGRVEAIGTGVEAVGEGDRVGIPWLVYTYGECNFLPRGAGELVSFSAVYRLSDRWRL
jgi:propanol-preferring alcohol dehydrogenase